jgi:hypothetical protein
MLRRRVHYAWIVACATFVVLIITAGIRATPGLLTVHSNTRNRRRLGISTTEIRELLRDARGTRDGLAIARMKR